MKALKFFLAVFCFLAAVILSLSTCKKLELPKATSDSNSNTNNNPGTVNTMPTNPTGLAHGAAYYVRLTDAPTTSFTAVNIDIQGVVVTGSGTNIALNVTPGIYNLLDFTNGIDTLIATGSLSIQTVEQIRLVLGSNNSVVAGNTTYPLNVPSGSQSGLKLQVHQTLQAGVSYEVLLDFIASQSIVQEGNGKYSLKPVIKTTDVALSGAIKGLVSPAVASTTVTSVSGTNTYSTLINANGEFIFSGLPPAGNYTVTATPPSTLYTTATVNNATVTLGVTTNVGTLNI